MNNPQEQRDGSPGLTDASRPRAQELHRKTEKGFEGTGVWYCTVCRVVWGGAYLNGLATPQEAAENCCGPSLCECGATKPKGYIRCNMCQSALERNRIRDRIERADKLDDWDSWVLDPNDNGPNEGYFASVEALMEWYEDQIADGEVFDLPQFAFATRENRFSVDIQSCISSALEDHYEDAGEALIGEEGIVAAFREWEAKQVIKSYGPDYSRAIRIPWASAAKPGEPASGEPEQDPVIKESLTTETTPAPGPGGIEG